MGVFGHNLDQVQPQAALLLYAIAEMRSIAKPFAHYR